MSHDEATKGSPQPSSSSFPNLANLHHRIDTQDTKKDATRGTVSTANNHQRNLPKAEDTSLLEGGSQPHHPFESLNRNAQEINLEDYEVSEEELRQSHATRSVPPQAFQRTLQSSVPAVPQLEETSFGDSNLIGLGVIGLDYKDAQNGNK